MDIQAPIPSINAAVEMRDISKYKEERVQASKSLKWNDASETSEEAIFAALTDAFYFGMITIYAQGLAQLTIAF